MVLSMGRWVGKVAIVTGASAGCGAAIAEALVNAGVQVVGFARRVEKIEQLSKTLEGKPGKLRGIKVDICNENDILQAFKWVEKNLGPVHILVNSAGISKLSNLRDGSTQAWVDIFNTNVIGLTIATREAVKVMEKYKIDGHIIHINSVLGHYVAQVPNIGIYPSSKFAVSALTETLRQELNSVDSKIKITSVSPGPVETEFQSVNGLYDDKNLGKFFSDVPKLQAEDVADAVIYALSTPSYVQVHDLMLRPIGEKV